MDNPRGRPFEAGNTFGRGRPKGSHNRGKSEEQRILDEFGPHVVRKCMARAIEGDPTAMRLCMERVSPLRRDAPIKMDLSSIRTARDVDRAAEMVTAGLRRGKFTASEGERMMNILESRLRMIEKVDFEQRLENLEQNLRDKKARGE
jgi:hypothetical protein